MKKTLVNIKISAGRTARDLWTLFKILLVAAVVLFAMATCQVELCRKAHPDRAILRCFKGY